MAYKMGVPGCCCYRCTGTLCFKVGYCGGYGVMPGATVTVRLGSPSGTVVFTGTTGSDGVTTTCYSYDFFSTLSSFYVIATPPSGVPHIATTSGPYTFSCTNLTILLALTLVEYAGSSGLFYKCCVFDGTVQPILIPPTGITYADSFYGTHSGNNTVAYSGEVGYPGCDDCVALPNSTTPFGTGLTWHLGCDSSGTYGPRNWPALYVDHPSYYLSGDGYYCPNSIFGSARHTVYFDLTSYSSNMLQFTEHFSDDKLYCGGGATVTVTW